MCGSFKTQERGPKSKISAFVGIEEMESLLG